LDLSRPKEELKPTYAFEGSFLACVTDDMVVLKFGSFVKEQQAKLMETKRGKVVVRLGNTLLPFWGSSIKRQPIEMHIKFGPPPKHVQKTIKQSVSERTYFEITITPRGWARDVQTFQARARRAFLMLKSYFVAD
jgi:hypothetical protein